MNFKEEEAMRMSFLVAIACAALLGLGLTLAAPRAQASECTVDADCDDGLFCTGLEYCVSGTCETSGPFCPVACIEREDKCVPVEQVTVCHRYVGNGANAAKTLSIGVNALAAHLEHGDLIGACAF